MTNRIKDILTVDVYYDGEVDSFYPTSEDDINNSYKVLSRKGDALIVMAERGWRPIVVGKLFKEAGVEKVVQLYNSGEDKLAFVYLKVDFAKPESYMKSSIQTKVNKVLSLVGRKPYKVKKQAKNTDTRQKTEAFILANNTFLADIKTVDVKFSYQSARNRLLNYFDMSTQEADLLISKNWKQAIATLRTNGRDFYSISRILRLAELTKDSVEYQEDKFILLDSLTDKKVLKAYTLLQSYTPHFTTCQEVDFNTTGIKEVQHYFDNDILDRKDTNVDSKSYWEAGMWNDILEGSLKVLVKLDKEGFVRQRINLLEYLDDDGKAKWAFNNCYGFSDQPKAIEVPGMVLDSPNGIPESQYTASNTYIN